MSENGRRMLLLLCESEDPLPRTRLEAEFGPGFYAVAGAIHKSLGAAVIERITGNDGRIVAYRLFADVRPNLCEALEGLAED